MATDTVFEGSVGFDGKLEADRVSARLVKAWSADEHDFNDIGTGASDSILLEGARKPLGPIVFCGMTSKCGTPDFAGEADVAYAVGFEGGDTDALIASTALNATGDGLHVVPVAGVLKAGQVISAAQLLTLAALYTATELGDLTAGSITHTLFYMDADA